MSWAAAVSLGILLQLAPGLAKELERLKGHDVTVAPDQLSYSLNDVAGEGKPIVGVVERRGAHLWLVTNTGQEYLLRGPLAIPRIAGPMYKVWVLGEVNGKSLRAKRLGVLAPPRTAR